MTLGNISKEIRRQPWKRAAVLIRYLPVCKMEAFNDHGKTRQMQQYQLFHMCMRSLLDPLVDAGTDGMDLLCADSFIRSGFPIVMAHISDHKEQVIVAGCQSNFCPICTVHPDKQGDPDSNAVPQSPEKTIEALDQADRLGCTSHLKKEGLHMLDPFWRDLPHCNIFSSFTPDLLHQLHKGVFKDHMCEWATASAEGGEDEVNSRFMASLDHASLRHFRNGISAVSQWTGHEYKNMEKVFLGVINGSSEERVVLAVRGVLDFIYNAHYEQHTTKSLCLLEESWALFHANKDVVIENGSRKQEHFNIPKVHSMKHYVDSICSQGTSDGYNTENTE